MPGGKGKGATDTLGGVNGFLVTQDRAQGGGVDFLNFFSQEKYAKEAAEKGAYDSRL